MLSRFIALTVLAWLPFAAAASGTILVLGDSLSAGYGLAREQAWPVLLQQRLSESQRPYTVVNASISGDTSAGGRARLPAALRQHRPDIVVIELGANDGLRGLPLTAMRANLTAMVEASRAAGARVLIVGMHLPPNYGPDYTTKFRDSFAAVARTTGAALVPFLLDGFAAERTLFQADGIHPTAAAQPRMLDNVWPVLEPLLKRRS